MLWLGTVPEVLAQQGKPHIGYAYPAGGKQGTTFEVKIGGQYLDGAANAFITGEGVQATVVEYLKPLSQQQANDLRMKLQSLLKGPKTEETQASIAQIWKRLANFVRKPASLAIAESVTLQVTVASDAPPGTYELRLGTGTGLSNPIAFQVNQLAEFREEPRPLSSSRFKFKKPNVDDRPPDSAGAGPEVAITLPSVVNGQIMPGDRDRFRFRATKGQRLVMETSARELIPYLADAVPGWFQATLALFDDEGKEVAYDDDFRFQPDPIVFYQIPKDGEYVLEIKDALYRGREDFVYRVAVGELPFVAGIFPLGGKIGTRTTVGVWGWNLPAAKLTVDVGNKAGNDTQPISVANKGLLSNRLQFLSDSLPEIREKESNDSATDAQAVTLPVIVNGLIGQPEDWDVFRFEGRAGDKVVAEVFARRLDSPLDSVLKLTSAAGVQLAFNDDHEDKGSGLKTHHADSLISATLPWTGPYFVHLGDAQLKGAWSYGYRLRISAPQPDFELRVVPSSISVRGGATVPLTVYVMRRDGFTGEIGISLKDAPEGFTLDGNRVPAGQDKVTFTLSAPPRPTETPLNLHVVGHAKIATRDVTHAAVPADDMMQAFEYRHLVPAQELLVSVSGRYMAKNGAVPVLSQMPLQIPAGGTARLRVGVPATSFVGPLALELSQPPEGIVIKDIVAMGKGTEIVLESDSEKVKPGLEGNLIVTVFADRGKAKSAKASKGKPQRFEVGTVPAIPFEIIK